MDVSYHGGIHPAATDVESSHHEEERLYYERREQQRKQKNKLRRRLLMMDLSLSTGRNAVAANSRRNSNEEAKAEDGFEENERRAIVAEESPGEGDASPDHAG